jgi:hypothetical protein
MKSTPNEVSATPISAERASSQLYNIVWMREREEMEETTLASLCASDSHIVEWNRREVEGDTLGCHTFVT